MCMKYVNATLCCYNSITKVDGKIISFNGAFDTIDIQNNCDPILNKFHIVTDFCIRGTNVEENKKNNPIESKRNIDVIIRMTKCNPDPQKRLCVDLDSFTIDIVNGNISKACFGYLNYRRVTEVNNLPLPEGLGKYVIKILVKFSDEDDTNYSIQTMHSLNVK